MENIKGILGYNRVSITCNARNIHVNVNCESALISAGKELNKLKLSFNLYKDSDQEYPLGWILYVDYPDRVFAILKEELRTEEQFQQSNIDALPAFFGYED
jgi:hypothetical protein